MSKFEKTLRVTVAVITFMALSIIGFTSSLWYVAILNVLAGSFVAFIIVDPVDEDNERRSK